MSLTPEQYTALRTAVQADPVLGLLTQSSASANAIADAFNLLNNPVVKVWDRNVIVDRIHNTIDDTKYTPADAPDGTQLFMNRAQAIIIKQMNLQTKILGRTSVDATQPLLRAALRDAIIGVPAGAGGANVNPGGASGVNVLTACLRSTTATRAEKLFSTGAQTTGTVTADVLSFEGRITKDQVDIAMGW